ncbi:MAG: hypothetical protein L3J06_02550 [Cyclobacteriaceae bacterium]|nr:hypothetical protein [Cyclobacteriaceae bacterium]
MSKLPLFFFSITVLIGCTANTKPNRYVNNDYHHPSDEFFNNWDMSGMVQNGILFYQIGSQLANNTSAWLKWKKGLEFKAIREEK